MSTDTAANNRQAQPDALEQEKLPGDASEVTVKAPKQGGRAKKVRPSIRQGKRTGTDEQLEPKATKKTAKKTKVLFVNRSYWPDMEATGQLLTELCESLVETGEYDVSVLCGRPNFVPDDVEYKSRGQEVRNGVTIRRVWHTQFDKKRFNRRIVNFVSFCVSAFLSLLFGKRPDVIICETDPPLSPIAGFLVSRIRRTKFVCYLQDIYPDIAVACGKVNEGFVTKVLRRVLVECYKRADRIVVLSDDMRNWMNSHEVDPSKIAVIQNWVDPERIYPIKENNPFRADHGLEDKFVVMYSGNIGQTQRFDTVLQAARNLRDEKDIVFAFVGGGVKLKSIQHQAEVSKLDNVRFYDYQPLDQLAASLSAADIQLILLDQKMTQLMMPSKLYSGLASGTPLLGIGQTDSQLAKIVVDNECGWFFECDDAKGIATKILYAKNDATMIQDAGSNARNQAVQSHTRKESVQQFQQLFELTSDVAHEDKAVAGETVGVKS